MPTKPPHKLLRQVGRRGSYLLFLAVLDIIYAYGLTAQTEQSATNPTYVFLTSVLPIGIWAGLWGLVGVLCLIFAFRRQDFPAYFAAMFIKVLWAAIFGLGWITGQVDRGYLSCVIWGAFAGVTGLISGWHESWWTEGDL